VDKFGKGAALKSRRSQERTIFVRPESLVWGALRPHQPGRLPAARAPRARSGQRALPQTSSRHESNSSPERRRRSPLPRDAGLLARGSWKTLDSGLFIHQWTESRFTGAVA